MWIWSSSTKNTDGSGQEKENIVDDTSSKEDVSENLKEESEDVNTDIDENKDSAVEDQENATQAQDQIEEFVLLSGTPVGDLYYPQKWEGMVSAEITEDDGYAAKIYGTVGEKKFLLYTLYIGSNQVEGFVFGYVDDTKVAFKVEEIDMSGISEEDELALYGMQDEINSIMDQIRNLDGYNEEELIVATEDEKEDIVLLDTPIGPLNYPGRWENAVSVVETSEGENYTAEIFGNIDGTQIKLYTMYIGDNENQIGAAILVVLGLMFYWAAFKIFKDPRLAKKNNKSLVQKMADPNYKNTAKSFKKKK